MGLPQWESSPILGEPVKKLKLHKRKKKILDDNFQEIKKMEKLENNIKNKFIRSFILTLVSGIVFFGLCFYSFLTVNNQNLELKKLETDKNTIKAKNDSIILELTPYTNSQTIEEIAKTSLGLDYPTEDQYIYLERE